MRPSRLLYIAVMTMGGPLAAQGLTDQELLERFEQQRDAIRAAENGELGGTRGLELIPVEDLTTTPDVAGVQDGATAPEAEPDTLASPAEQPAAPESESSSTVVYASLPEVSRIDILVTFPFDSASLEDEELPKLDQLCNVMGPSDIALFRIVGHTDAAGSDEYNERLSLLRAQEVRRYFVETCGMEADRLEAVGMGERFLADPEDPRSSENRRVEFQALS